MAQLTTTTSASQSATQSPQTAGTSTNGAASTSSVQPGTATTLLNNPTTGNTSGIPLGGNALTTVNLNAPAASTTTATAVAKPVARHINPALFTVSIVLFVFAIALFWLTSRSEKNTTD